MLPLICCATVNKSLFFSGTEFFYLSPVKLDWKVPEDPFSHFLGFLGLSQAAGNSGIASLLIPKFVFPLTGAEKGNSIGCCFVRSRARSYNLNFSSGLALVSSVNLGKLLVLYESLLPF